MITIEFWIILAVILVIIELYTNSLILVSTALGCITAAILGYYSYDLWIQLPGFVTVSIICIILTRPLADKLTAKKYYSNTEQLIGKQALVTKKIKPNSPGEVKVQGHQWLAVSDDVLDTDTLVEITGIESTKLVVKKLD